MLPHLLGRSERERLGMSGKAWVVVGRSGYEWGGLGMSGKVWVGVGRSGNEWGGLGRSGKQGLGMRSGYEWEGFTCSQV